MEALGPVAVAGDDGVACEPSVLCHPRARCRLTEAVHRHRALLCSEHVRCYNVSLPPPDGFANDDPEGDLGAPIPDPNDGQ